MPCSVCKRKLRLQNDTFEGFRITCQQTIVYVKKEVCQYSDLDRFKVTSCWLVNGHCHRFFLDPCVMKAEVFDEEYLDKGLTF